MNIYEWLSLFIRKTMSINSIQHFRKMLNGIYALFYDLKKMLNPFGMSNPTFLNRNLYSLSTVPYVDIGCLQNKIKQCHEKRIYFTTRDVLMCEFVVQLLFKMVFVKNIYTQNIKRIKETRFSILSGKINNR